jgi:hypothetical protein
MRYTWHTLKPDTFQRRTFQRRSLWQGHFRRHGTGHLNRLIHAMFDILEDTSQTPELRVKTGGILLDALARRTPTKRKKSPSELAVARLVGGPPKAFPKPTQPKHTS